MRSHQIIECAGYDPSTLLEIGRAFERAWAEIEHDFGEPDVEQARTRLAEAILIVAVNRDRHDIGGLTTEALQVLALTYRRRWPLDWH